MTNILLLIEESAIHPDKWSHVLDEICDRIGADGGYIYTSQRVGVNSSKGFPSSGTERWNRSIDFIKSVRWIGSNHTMSGFKLLRDLLPEIYHASRQDKNIKGEGFEFSESDEVLSVLTLSRGVVAVVGFYRLNSSGHFPNSIIDIINKYYRHIAKSLYLSMEITESIAMSITNAIGALGIPAAVVDYDMEVISANQYMLRSGLMQEGFKNGDMSIRRRLKEYLTPLVRDSRSSSTVINELSNADGVRETIVAHVFRLWSNESDTELWLRNNRLVVFGGLCDDNLLVPVDILQSVYGLTKREADLCQMLAKGFNLRDSAKNLGIGFGTARSYLLRIFQKTQTNHQGALVSKIISLSPIFRLADLKAVSKEVE